MKKVVTMILVVAMLISAVAFADGIPSKTTSDMIQFTVETENPGSENAALYAAPSYAAEIALKDLIKAGSAEKYFNDPACAGMNVDEFTGLFASNFAENCGNVTATAKFPTPYEVDEQVVIMVGLVGNSGATWTAYEGIGVESSEAGKGCIRVVLPQDTVLAVQNGTGLISVLSK